MSVHANFKRGANVRRSYVLHSLFTDNQLTDVTTNRQDKSPTVTILGKRMKENRFVKHNSSTMVVNFGFLHIIFVFDAPALAIRYVANPVRTRSNLYISIEHQFYEAPFYYKTPYFVISQIHFLMSQNQFC